jgi:hypothetical protein
MDVVALDQCLDETNDHLDTTLVRFSERQVPEGLALWQLLQLPPKTPILFSWLYQCIQVTLILLRRIRWIRKWIPKDTQTLLSQTLTPFTEIVRRVSII